MNQYKQPAICHSARFTVSWNHCSGPKFQWKTRLLYFRAHCKDVKIYVSDVEAVRQSIWKISSSSWLLKSHWSYHVLTGICASVCLSVVEIGPSSFLTFNLKMNSSSWQSETLWWFPLLWSGTAVLQKFWACRFQESCPCSSLLVEADLWLLSDVIAQWKCAMKMCSSSWNSFDVFFFFLYLWQKF